MLTAIAKPFGWLLMFIYELVSNYGLAVIIFALIVKLILLPFGMKSKRGTMKMARFQPKMKELEKKYEGNQRKYQEEVQKLYKQEKVSPTSGCIWSLIPFPILIALYQAIRMPITVMMNVGTDAYTKIQEVLSSLGFTSSMSSAYVEIAQSQFISEHFSAFAALSDKLHQIDYSFLGMNLGDVPQWNFMFHMESGEAIWPKLGIFLLPIISAALTLLTSWISQKTNPSPAAEQQGGTMKIMMLVMPLISLWIGFVMPAALCVYWIASSVFGLAQEVWLTRRYNRILDKEEEESRILQAAKEAELAEKRAKTEALREQNATERNPNTSKKKIQQNEKQQNKEKAAEWDKRDKPAPDAPAGAVGERRYARGRAYMEDRYASAAPAESAADEEDAVFVQPEETAGACPAEDTAPELDSSFSDALEEDIPSDEADMEEDAAAVEDTDADAPDAEPSENDEN